VTQQPARPEERAMGLAARRRSLVYCTAHAASGW